MCHKAMLKKERTFLFVFTVGCLVVLHHTFSRLTGVRPHHHTHVPSTSGDQLATTVAEPNICHVGRVTYILLALGMLSLQEQERRKGEKGEGRREGGREGRREGGREGGRYIDTKGQSGRERYGETNGRKESEIQRNKWREGERGKKDKERKRITEKERHSRKENGKHIVKYIQLLRS